MKLFQFFLFILSYTAHAQCSFEENLITKEGAWCWFADPRALHYENRAGTINCTYVGYIDVHGYIKATQWNHLTNTVNEVLVRSYFEPDDHNCPSFLVLPDERVMIFYSRHSNEKCFYYRISKKPGDITMLGEEKKILTADNTTYPSSFILSDDPAHFYLCWRGIKWHPTIAQLSMPDQNDNVSFTWGPYQIVNYDAANARPYAKYTSNGKNKIYMSFTTTHPDNQTPNYVYFAYIDINTKELKDVTNAVISNIANGPHNINITAQYASQYPHTIVDSDVKSRDWVWEVSMDSAGAPVIAMVRISSDKTSHDYYYAKWADTTWQKTFLTNAGGAFHQTPGLELCYSGGMSINKENPNQIYCSVPVNGTYGKVYEIIKYTVGDNGKVTKEMITNNSRKNNIRPFSIPHSENSPLKFVWMNGDYYDWMVSSLRPSGFPTAIKSNVKLPAGSIALDSGLIKCGDFKNATAFTVSLSLTISVNEYYGKIMQAGTVVYGLTASTLKPYVFDGNNIYNSTNLLANSDVWQTENRDTGGKWYAPTKLGCFNLTITYENNLLTTYINGLIDQCIEIPDLILGDVRTGEFTGLVKDCRVYNRALTQGEVKAIIH